VLPIPPGSRVSKAPKATNLSKVILAPGVANISELDKAKIQGGAIIEVFGDNKG
jgi:hypothetical protein